MKSRVSIGPMPFVCLTIFTIAACPAQQRVPEPDNGVGNEQGGTDGNGGSGGKGGGGRPAQGTGGAVAEAGGAGGVPSASGGAPANSDARGAGGSPAPLDMGAPQSAAELTGKVARTVFKITCSARIGDGTSGPIPSAQENQRNEDMLKGDATRSYDVSFHVRGLVEPRIYEGGTPDATNPWLLVGGMPSDVNREHGRQYGVFKIEVSEPRQVYFLNRDQRLKNHELYKLDYKVVVRARGGATVSMVFADRASSGAIANHRSVVVDDVPAEVVAQPFKDQFMWIEVDSVAPAP
jgi:hypothetical protein